MASKTEGLMQTLAATLGSTESPLRFILSQLLGYPLAVLYRRVVYGQTATTQHIFFILTGLWIACFNFGFHAIHTVLNVLGVYIILQTCAGTRLSLWLAIIFNNVYLVLGYYILDNYEDICWTTPHCVLTLKLTGLAFDLYDSQKKEEKLSAEQKATVLKEPPSLLAMLGHAFFFGGYLAGPQFSMKRYLSFTSGTLQEKPSKDPPASVIPGLKRLGLGIVYIASYHIGGLVFSTESYRDDSFQDLSWVSKFFYITLWGRVILNKYIGSWLIAEGTCILVGVSYNGKDINGNIEWNGVCNVQLRKLEEGYRLRDYIQSFNYNTNQWMAKYVFKRLRFLGNKFLSQAVTLFYLAMWHGTRSGYYMNFALEFIMMNCENQVMALTPRIPALEKFNSSPILQPVLYILKKLITTFCMGYALLSFVLLNFNDYTKVYSQLYFIGHVFFLGWPLLHFIIRSMFVRNKSSSNGHLSEKKDSTVEKPKEE
ncbi:lysophospholipid acyltransferase 5-like [Pecten maximus]|uniref:lysophospholipid acyltransferase 5-like n=1 Tax=Pecten maximus TaxID=6579 RepID=UPI0014581D1A|nr:lysophospholipid acyltransferase 5-like [Pecten maximus]